MPFNDLEPVEKQPQPDWILELTEQLPGVIFQLHRAPDGQMHFPYLAGNGTHLTGLDRRDLAHNALPALERLAEEDYPRLMAAIERSARFQSPITTKFRLRRVDDQHSWIALRAQPRKIDTGVLWFGLMIDISEQMAEEQRLRRLSDTDDLTGLANRRKLMQRLDAEISLSNRHTFPLSLMMLDIDHFKSVNDTWGHLQGDQVLKDLAQLCREMLREEDLVARLGGEEFALLLPLTPELHCRQLAERLCERVAVHDFGVGPGRITVSIGIAEHRIGDSCDALIHRADDNLYAAKRGGRNQVMVGV
ncbi:GGDEF domain-containing protein [Halomonas daqiaonensis]|uniref:diguanylate cyclase n=1 Tax=Halomonas daqiaonensis TaxID=650850 RepID=A0A1H7H8R8_9GAMM|nr:sensor domain-containing diguanylate cyclase [Halomonas daqiaonensis]SEK46639.1 diguanylate cyclase (GGDEF) domain-containing protein [Halomonas daqiaonensis]